MYTLSIQQSVGSGSRRYLSARHDMHDKGSSAKTTCNVVAVRIPRHHRPPPLYEHAGMATEPTAQAPKQPMTAPELIAFVKNELDADEERQAKVSAASAGELPRESQTGSTLDLSHKNINALPVEVVILIKDKVERYTQSGGGRMCAAMCSR